MNRWLRRLFGVYSLAPDIEAFNQAIIRSVSGRNHDGFAIAQDFRALINRNPDLGKRVIFMLLHWCGEYDAPPESNDQLQRWAGKREIADRIKAAMYGDLSAPEVEEIKDDDLR